MKEWMFELHDTVSIIESGEVGKVIGRAEFDHQDNLYLVRYKTGDCRAVENWWTETALCGYGY